MSGSVTSPFRQPKAVFAVAFACVVSFMGIGLVDPILPSISHELHASPSEVTLLFTSYLVVTAVAMLITNWLRGPRYASRASRSSRACWPRLRRTAARRSSARCSSAGSATTRASACSGGRSATRSERIAARCAAMR